MRLLRFSVNGGEARLGLITGEAVVDLTARIDELGSDMNHLIERWDHYHSRVKDTASRADYPLSEMVILAPIQRPGKIFAIGLNYADHVAESGLERPQHQVWFSKASTAVAGPYDPVQLPRVSNTLDYEAELVIVIGRKCRHVLAAKASEVIFGYAVGNDFTVREWQMRSKPPQFTLSKSFDTHAPFGPFIVTADEITPDELGIRSFVNGEKRQDSNTRELIFNCAAQIEELSAAMTLEPGDLIFTGTPGGVGMAMKPPIYLKPGDRVRCEIDRLGYIENQISAEP